jgi:guanylate kinase
VVGPSGVGKTSVVAGLLARDPDLILSVSVTTRRPRPAERDGIDYRFVSEDEFDRLEAAGAFLESATVHGARYGTSRDQVERALAAGRTIVLDIDVQGARNVRAAMPSALTVFIEPPSTEVLRRRLQARSTESPAALEVRLAAAEVEMGAAGEFDHRIVNDVLEQAVEGLGRILEGTPADKE